MKLRYIKVLVLQLCDKFDSALVTNAGLLDKLYFISQSSFILLDAPCNNIFVFRTVLEFIKYDSLLGNRIVNQ